MSVENKQVRGDASVSRNVNAGGNARVQGNMHVGHNLRVDGAVEARNIKAANKGLFLDEAQLKARYPQPEEGWFAGVGSSSPFVVYIARNGEWQRTNGTFSVDVDMDSYNQRIDELESQVESNNALIAELIEIIREGGGSADLVMITVENDNPTWGSVSGGGLKRKGSVTLTATAENGYHFVEWQDAEGNTIAGAGATYTFEATESVTLKAVFAVSYFAVTAAPNDSTLGSVSVSPAVPAGQSGYTYGTQLTLTATANAMHSPQAFFSKWNDETGRTVGRVRTVTATEDKQYTAIFAEVAEIIGGVDSGSTGMGTVNMTINGVAGSEAHIGDTVAITAVAGASHEFSHWVDGDGNIIEDAGTVYTFTFAADSPTEYYAVFETPTVVRRTVSVASNNAQMGSAAITLDNEDKTSVTVEDGTSVLLKATANTGFAFEHWKKGDEVLDWSAEHELTVSEDATYTAVFAPSGSPDYYYGVVDTPTGSEYAADYADLMDDMQGGYLALSNKAEMTMPSGKTFIILYDETKVQPATYKIRTDFGDDTGTDFDNARKFYTSVREIDGINYNSIELIGGSMSDDPMPVEITFTEASQE